MGFLRCERFLDLTAGIVVWHDPPSFAGKIAPEDFTCYPSIDCDWPATAARDRVLGRN